MQWNLIKPSEMLKSIFTNATSAHRLEIVSADVSVIDLLRR